MKESFKKNLFGFQDKKTEHLFRIDYQKKLITQIRIGFIISIIIYLVFYFIDNWVFPELEPILLLNRIAATSLFAFILPFHSPNISNATCRVFSCFLALLPPLASSGNSGCSIFTATTFLFSIRDSSSLQASFPFICAFVSFTPHY